MLYCQLHNHYKGFFLKLQGKSLTLLNTFIKALLYIFYGIMLFKHFLSIIYLGLSTAMSISVSTSFSILYPFAFQSIGYMLMPVKPGRVFISLNTTQSVSFSRKKSTLESPMPSCALNILTATRRISSSLPSGNFGPTTVF